MVPSDLKNSDEKNNDKTYPCPYNDCQLSDNNINYIIQFFYLIIAYFALIKDRNDFTATNIILFITPVEIDILFAYMPTKILKFTKFILSVYISFLFLISFLLLFDFFDVKDTVFVVKNSVMLLSGYELNKNLFAKMLVPLLTVPLMIFIGSPTRNRTHTLNCI